MLPIEYEQLQADWAGLLHTYTEDAAAVQAAFNDLTTRYMTADRHYHTLDHIRSMLETVRSIGEPARNGAALDLAVWFHDAVYESRAGDNEERSAELARTVLGPLGVPTTILDETARLIVLTKTHQANANDVDGRLLLDADLSVLGAEESKYDCYATAIRQEYDWVAEDAYRAGRRGVLEGFLQRPRIYRTDAMFARLETNARCNLRREIAALGGDAP